MNYDQQLIGNYINNHFQLPREYSPFFSINEISLKTAIYLLAFLKSNPYESYTYYHTNSEYNNDDKVKIAPTNELKTDIINNLLEESIIAPNSFDIDSYNVDQTKGEIVSFYIYKTDYDILLGKDETESINFVERLESIIGSPSKWPTSWAKEIPDIWKELVSHECYEYLMYKANEYSLEVNTIGAKTETVISKLLTSYSLTQAYYFIWRAIKDAAAYAQKESISIAHASNTIIGNIERSIDRFQLENWEPKSYGRDYNLPRTHLNHILYDKILQIGQNELNTTFESVSYISESYSINTRAISITLMEVNSFINISELINNLYQQKLSDNSIDTAKNFQLAEHQLKYLLLSFNEKKQAELFILCRYPIQELDRLVEQHILHEEVESILNTKNNGNDILGTIESLEPANRIRNIEQNLMYLVGEEMIN